jgi:hypothetical protein
MPCGDAQMALKRTTRSQPGARWRLALVAMLALGACRSSTKQPDAAADAGAGGSDGQADGSGGQSDGSSCRRAGALCTTTEPCCGALICTGVCTTGLVLDGSIEKNFVCSYPEGGAPLDGSAFRGVCPEGECPAGSVCVVEIGGVAGGGGEYCAPIPNECFGIPSCACMGACVCTDGYGRPEDCSDDGFGGIACDNGIR